VIGRDPRCQLRPASEAISRVHTRIDQREGRVFVRDMGTTNGTLVGERLLQGEEAEAHDGDRIQIGPLIFTLSVAAVAPAPAKTDETEDAAASWLLQSPAPAPGDTALLPAVTPVPTSSAGTAEEPAARPAPTDFKRLQTQVVGDALLATVLPAELVDEEQIGPVRHELIALLDQPVPKRVVLKLDRVTILSSLAVAMLLSHFQRLDRFGGGMRLCKVRDEVFPALESLISTGAISVYPSVDQAVKDPWPIT
jgi:predicted component of type VI protein secretion system